MKGWYGQSQRHKLASKGIKTTKNTHKIKENKKYKVIKEDGNNVFIEWKKTEFKPVKDGKFLIDTFGTGKKIFMGFGFNEYLIYGEGWSYDCFQDNEFGNLDDVERINYARVTTHDELPYEIIEEMEMYGEGYDVVDVEHISHEDLPYGLSIIMLKKTWVKTDKGVFLL